MKVPFDAIRRKLPTATPVTAPEQRREQIASRHLPYHRTLAGPGDAERAAKGESDMAYLVGDDDHPLLPNVILFAGPGATISYEPDPANMALLDYDRQQIKAQIRDIAAATLPAS